MNLKQNAAGRKPAAFQQRNTSTDRAHDTTTPSRLDLSVILSRVSLENIVQQAGAKLHRAGNDWRGTCPLHKGDNPTAFSVYVGEGGYERWHCHTKCDAGGDAIDFVQRWQGLDFMGAVKYLAEQLHLDLADLGFDPGVVQREMEHKNQTDLLDEAARYFAVQLWSKAGELARKYLLGRGFTEKTLREAGWGFCKSDRGLQLHLQKTSADLDMAKKLGLIRADGLDFTANGDGDKASVDGYIIYPHTWNGKTTYFSARALKPKDPNDKSRNLPGGRQVYWALAPGDPHLIIVEGQADAESLRQLGRTALALCGVGNLSAQEIVRVQNRRVVYLALDNDLRKSKLSPAEQDKIRKRKANATRRLCEALGGVVMIVPNMPAKDMNEWLQNGLTLQVLEKHLGNSKSWLDILIDQGKSQSPVELDETVQIITRHIVSLPDTLRARYVSQIEKKLSIPKRDLKNLMSQREEENGNLYSEIRERRLHFMGDPLGNFWARISHELMVDDGLNPPTVRYSIEGGLASGQFLQPVQVEARAFGKLDWIADSWGMRPIITLPPGKSYILARAIQEVSMDSVQRERLYTFTGWHDCDGQRGFLTASGWLGEEGLNDQVRVDLGSNNLRHYALPKDEIDPAEAVHATLEFLQLGPRNVTAPLWAAMYAAPLTSLRPLNAVLSVYGTTQSGKSTLAHLALTHFGTGFVQGRDYHAPIDWTSTMTAIEAAMFLAKDVPLVIDDFAPQFSSLAEARAMHKKAHHVVRSVGNRSARSRSRADLSQQNTRFPRGLVIMTAENPLVGQSIVGRMLYVGVEPGDILPATGNSSNNENKLTHLQIKAQQGLLAQAMKLYLQYLSENWGRIAKEYPVMVDQVAQAARQVSSLQNRLPDAYAVLAAAQELALRCFEDMQLISWKDADEMIVENNQALLGLIQNQAEQVAAESPVRKFFTAISSLLVEGKVYLAPRTQDEEYQPPLHANPIGYYDPGPEQKVIYLRTETSLAQAKEFWRGLDENLDIMPDALRRQLRQVDGLLAQVGERQVEASKLCAGIRQRVLIVDVHRVEQLYGVSLARSEN
ncbi:MAG: DNA primase [Anaerolineales bacterium]|nr:DNA primase [Anaerolineales bacterium]